MLKTKSCVWVGLFALLSIFFTPYTASAVSLDTWQKLVDLAGETSTSVSEANIDQEVVAGAGAAKIEIPAGKTVTLTGSGKLQGFGNESILVKKGGKLVLAGPTVTNCQIVVQGEMSFTAGSIRDTIINGPILFVEGGTLNIGDGAVFEKNRSADISPTGGPSTINGQDYAPITVYGGTLNVSGGQITANEGFRKGGAIGVWGTDTALAKLNLLGGTISKNLVSNPTYNGFGGGVYANNTDVVLDGSTIASNNTEFGGGISVFNGSFTMKDGVIESNNNGEYGGIGGGALLESTKIVISGGQIRKNTANGPGGGIYVNNSELSISGGIFSENAAVLTRDAFGGGINISGGTTKITGGRFVKNSAKQSGGGIKLSGPSQAEIHAGYIADNVSEGFYGGGGIFNDNGATLKIYNAVVRNNRAEGTTLIQAGNHPVSVQGGGIWNCEFGETTFHVTKGVALYDNYARDAGSQQQYRGAGDDFASVSTHWFGNFDKGQPVSINERMLGGGKRIWYQDGSIHGIHSNWEESKQLPRYSELIKDEAKAKELKPISYNTEILENKAFKAVPEDQSKAAADQLARVVIENNHTTQAGLSGGGIGNNGHLIFGESDTWTLKINKTWNFDDPNTRPTKITANILVGKHKVDQVTLSEDNNWNAEITGFPNPETLIDPQTGKLLPITFEETGADGYTLEVSEPTIDKNANTYTFNLNNAKYVSVPVKKVWDDGDNAGSIRPQSVSVKLLADGKPAGEIVLNTENNWKGVFVNQPKYFQGKEIQYTVTETPVSGYSSLIQGDMFNGFTITNKYIPSTPPKPKKLPKTGL